MEEADREAGDTAGSCAVVLGGKAGAESAVALLENARRASAGAGDVTIRCTTLEAVDTRTVQILLALQRELSASGRGFRMVDVPEAIARLLAATGLAALAAAQTDGADDGAR
jgi:anti-anti-sigma regulatory factor